jgi:K+-sensing histidine kinase KdpD
VATGQVYWTANARDAELHLTPQTAGNGVVTTRNYSLQTDRLTGIQAGASNGIANFSYNYDVLGNLLTRTDANQSLSESFSLIDNAVKYGGGAPTRLDRAFGRAITINDDGPGIPVDQREKAFAPFYRLEGSRNRDTGGVGLGLAVARTIAREHGGDITLAAADGGGRRVRLELPA